MRILITGGSGFIGSNIAEELSKDDENDVIVLDNLISGDLGNVKDLDVKFVKGDILDLNLLEKLLEDVDYVFHQAAQVSVPESILDPMRTNEINVRGTLNILKASADNNVKKVINASSCAVYGDSPLDNHPLREETPLQPKSPYAVSKIASELYCNVFTEVYGLKTASLRYFNVYGPRQNPASQYAAVIPKFIERVLKGEKITIYGDGRQTRDFIYVKDIVRANIKMIKTNECGVYNICTGVEITILELAERIIDLASTKVPIVHEKSREGDILRSVGNNEKIKSIGFSPTYSIEEGLKETYQWYEQYINP